MKVSTLLEKLNQLSPDENVCAILLDKSMYEYQEDEDLVLTEEAWEKVCNDFDEAPFANLFEFVHESVMDYSEFRTAGLTRSEYASKMGLTEEAVDNW